MEGVRAFLESSTIHGLVYISTTKKKLVKTCWILVVIGGFTAAGYMIYQSFQDWHESPVKTTIDTLPITKITFPKVTVCPPKNTYTDLNYDLMMTENMTLDNDTRNELENLAKELLNDHLHENIMTDLSKVVESDRYYNWYHGYTDIYLPQHHYSDGVKYYVDTAATSGFFSTWYFGEKFDAAKVDTGPLTYKIRVNPPDSVRNNQNVMLHFDVKKVSLEDLSSGEDTLSVVSNMRYEIMEASQKSFNFTLQHTDTHYILLVRNVNLADVRKQKLSENPGFRFSWHYSGMKVEPEAKYRNTLGTKTFVRNCSNEIPIFGINHISQCIKMLSVK